FGRLRGRARAVVRRTLECKRLHRRALRGPGSSGDGSGRSDPAGYLHTRAAPGRLELLAATHPVTGDQLLTHHRLEAADMGYRDVVSLGFLLARAPVTGTLEPRRVAVPWASRFGLE